MTLRHTHTIKLVSCLLLLSLFVLAPKALGQNENDQLSISEKKMTPPMAAIKPTSLENHGIKRVDDYFWLNQREDKQVLDYLNAENAYTESVLGDVKELEQELFEEIKGRIKQDDSSVPYTDRGFIYYTRYEEGKQYPIHCRKNASGDASEQIMLNVNELAEGHSFCRVSGLRISHDGKLAAFGVDFTGRRKYQLRFKDLTTGKMLSDQVDDVTGGCVWAKDNNCLLYTSDAADE